MTKPKPGDKIYVDSALYLGHGEDDFLGGLCTVAAARAEMNLGKEVTYVQIEERPNVWTLWDEHLDSKQVELEKKYGQKNGRMESDPRTEFNNG